MKSIVRTAGLLAGLFFPFSAAWATTFGPLPVYQQAQHTGYFVHGRVSSGPDVQILQQYNKPYTYWTIEIEEQTQGESLGSRVTIREPGGEVGDLGYHVAASAEFAVGEDVYVALHDTEQSPGIKEVTGLTSGKYNVETMPSGKQVVVSGLGLPVTGEQGPLTPQEFTALLRRIAKGEATAADKDVWVSRKPTHEKDENPELEALARKYLGSPSRHPADTATGTETGPVSSGTQQSPNPSSLKANSAQESPPKADEASTGFSSLGWLFALAVLAVLVFGFFLMLRR